jgi:predicted amidohydrolase YtcJ
MTKLSSAQQSVLAIDSAVTRIDDDGTTVYGPEERVTLEQAIRSHTFETTHLTLDEREQGSLEVDKWADMVVLSDDIFTVPPDQIRHISVE